MLIEFELVNLFKESRHVLATTSVLVMFKWTYRILLEITKLSSTQQQIHGALLEISAAFSLTDVVLLSYVIMSGRVCRRPVVPRGLWSSVSGFSSSRVIVIKRLSDPIKRMINLTWGVPLCTTLILIIDVFQPTRLLTLSFLFV